MMNLLRDSVAILRTCDHPPIANLRDLPSEELAHDSLALGNLFLGKQGSGKSMALAAHRVDYHIRHPEHSMFSLDSSGSLTDDFLAYASSLPEWAQLRRRIRYVRLADPNWVMASPSLSGDYRTPVESQVERVNQVFIRLAEELADAPILGMTALKGILPNMLRLLFATCRRSDDGMPWQVTEAGLLLDDSQKLKKLMDQCGNAVSSEVKSFFNTRFVNLKAQERELRSYSLSGLFASLLPDDVQLLVGYPRPAWTPKDAIDQGLIVLIDGQNTVGMPNVQRFVFTHYFSLIMEAIKLRRPHSDADHPVALVVDEVKNILRIPGMSAEIEDIAPLYRNRGLQFYLAIQSLSQLDRNLKESIWNTGNVLCFSLLNKEDALIVARQLFRYDPQTVKHYPRTSAQNPTTEPEQGQDRVAADWIADLKHRELVMRRHLSEKEKDPYIRHVARTRDIAITTDRARLEEIKQELLSEHGVTVSEAKRAIARRLASLSATKVPPKA